MASASSISSGLTAKVTSSDVGVMAQEVQKIDPPAVSYDNDGYLMVDYDRLGIKFMTWNEWRVMNGRGGAR